MTLMLELPKNVEEDLAAEAARQGLPLKEYALRLLSTAAHRHSAKTGAEIVEYWQKEGLIGTRPDVADSQQHARAIREAAERRNHV